MSDCTPNCDCRHTGATPRKGKRTPQVPAMTGMTPLGVTDTHKYGTGQHKHGPTMSHGYIFAERGSKMWCDRATEEEVNQ